MIFMMPTICSQLGVDCAVYWYFSNKNFYGAWWVGFTLILISLMSMVMNSIYGFVGVFFLAIAGAVVSFIGVSFDSSG